mmetsp:Transcript_96846/g.153381  ORF Transcript_96846/g.153381 Transcript_96846/m.153381 type:complete len:175 (-) Transcript_96846:59-583(-)
MKPAWDKLMDDFKDSKSALVADVDCTGAGQSLCTKNNVGGYPTIKHGDPNDLQDYKGGRTYEDLKKFADENLGPTCGPENLDLCSDEDKATVEKFMAMDIADLDKAIGEVDEKIKKIEDKSAKAVGKLEAKIKDVQKEIEKETKKKDATLAKEKKKIGLGMMRAAAAAKKKQEM